MTKTFEEVAQSELEQANNIYEAYQGRFKPEIPDGGLVVRIGDQILRLPWLEFAKNWHSNEEYQELLKENNKLKFKLQQQALPVVPECVAKWYEEHKDDLEHGIYSINVSLDKTAIGELTDVERWFNDVSNEPNETIFIMKRLGYQVEKPQLFYIELPNVYGLKNKVSVSKVENGTIVEFSNGKNYALKLTEQEIKLIDERYWKFAVPVEDGE